MATVDQFSENLRQTAKEVLDLWWWWIVKGILAVIFGIAAWAWPDLTLTTLIWLLGAYIVADGILDVLGFITFSDLTWGRRILLGLWGVLQIAGGIAIWFAPGLGVLTLMVVVGIWLLATGVFLIVSAFTSDGHLMSPWLQALLGSLGAIAGVYLIIEPGAGALASVWVLGVAAIVYGIGQVFAGFQMRGLRNQLYPS